LRIVPIITKGKEMMRLLLIIIVAFIPVLCFGQQKTERVYFDGNRQMTDSSNAKFIKETIYYDTALGNGKIIEYDSNNKIISEIEYSNIKKSTRNGLAIEYHDNGAIKSKVMYLDGELDGECFTFYDDGKIRRYDIFKNNELVSGSCFSLDGEEIPHFPYLQDPVYIGGNQAFFKFLQDNVVYPRKARRKGIEGQVVVAVIIDRQGKVRIPRIAKSVHKLLDDEALRAVNKLGDWSPGLVDGYPIDLKISIPVVFRLK
jgi:TonB family protein